MTIATFLLVVSSAGIIFTNIITIVERHNSPTKRNYSLRLAIISCVFGLPSTLYITWASSHYTGTDAMVIIYWILYFFTSNLTVIMNKRKWNNIEFDDANGFFILFMLIISQWLFYQHANIFIYGAVSYAISCIAVMFIKPLKQ